MESTKKRIAMQFAYEDAYECQYYGCNKKYWLNGNRELSKEDLDMIWKRATNDLANNKPCGYVFASRKDFSEIAKTIIEEKCQ